jgi:hypothetical protein
VYSVACSEIAVAARITPTGWAPLPEDCALRAATAISLHATEYTDFTLADFAAYEGAALLVDLLKAADALDRYRLPLTRWWPDTTRLRHQPPPWLPSHAHHLVVTTETARLDGTDLQRAFRDSPGER